MRVVILFTFVRIVILINFLNRELFASRSSAISIGWRAQDDFSQIFIRILSWQRLRLLTLKNICSFVL